MENLTNERIDELIEIFEMSENNLEKMEELNSEIKTYLNDENFNEKYNEIKTMFEKMNGYIQENETTKNELKEHIEILKEYKTITLRIEKSIKEIGLDMDKKVNTFGKVEKILSSSIPLLGINIATTLIIIHGFFK